MTTALQGLKKFWLDPNNALSQKRAKKNAISKYILCCPLCKRGRVEELSSFDIEEDTPIACDYCGEYQELNKFNIQKI